MGILDQRSSVTILSNNDNERKERFAIYKVFFTYLVHSHFCLLTVVWSRASDIRELDDFRFPPLAISPC